MLIVYIGNNLGFVAHYTLLDQWTAVAMNGLMAVQTHRFLRRHRQGLGNIASFGIILR
jgi:hypothetical protein